MFKSAYMGWIKYYNSNSRLIGQYLRLRNVNHKLQKLKFLGIWLKKCSQTLVQMKAAKRIINIRNKKAIKSRFVTWTEQVKFLNSLDKRVVGFWHTYNNKDKLAHIKKLRTFTINRKLNF